MRQFRCDPIAEPAELCLETSQARLQLVLTFAQLPDLPTRLHVLDVQQLKPVVDAGECGAGFVECSAGFGVHVTKLRHRVPWLHSGLSQFITAFDAPILVRPPDRPERDLRVVGRHPDGRPMYVTVRLVSGWVIFTCLHIQPPRGERDYGRHISAIVMEDI